MKCSIIKISNFKILQFEKFKISKKFEIWNITKNVQLGKFQKFPTSKIPKVFNLDNSKNFQFGKFKVFELDDSKKFRIGKFQKSI